MAANNDRDSQRRFYTSGSNAYKYDVPFAGQEERQEVYAAPQQGETGTHQQTVRATRTKLLRGLAVALACITLGIFQVAQYEKLTSANMVVNKLKNNISTLETEIEDLNVELQYALDISTAQSIAREKLGMDYPESSQIAGGSSVMASAGARSASSGTESKDAGFIPSFAAVPVSVSEEG